MKRALGPVAFSFVFVVACGARVTLGTLSSDVADDPPPVDASAPCEGSACATPIVDAGLDASEPEDAADVRSDAPSTYEPCRGLACGAECHECPPADPTCVETTVVKYCTADGRCSPTAPACGDAGTGYRPCDGKRCGAGCTLCPPGAPNCFEPAVPKQCDPSGACRMEAVQCP